MLIPAFVGNARASQGMEDFGNAVLDFGQEIHNITNEAIVLHETLLFDLFFRRKVLTPSILQWRICLVHCRPRKR